jgi:hypothetical protein
MVSRAFKSDFILGVQGSGFKVLGSGFKVLGSGFWVQGSGFKVQGSGFKVLGSGFRVQGSGFRSSGFWVSILLPVFLLSGSLEKASTWDVGAVFNREIKCRGWKPLPLK